MAGDEIRISEAARFLIHDAWGGMVGRSDEFRQFADWLDQTTAALADVYAARTGQKKARILEWMGRETAFTAREAVQYGFADALVPNKTSAAIARRRNPVSGAGNGPQTPGRT